MADQESNDVKKPAKVSRREFLRGVGAAGAATAFATAILNGPQSDDAVASASVTDDSNAVIQSGRINLTLNVNGESRKCTVEPRTTLLNALRNHLDPAVTGPKIVCDRGSCGACTVEMNGKTVYACMILAADAVGKRIVTIESLSPDSEHLSPIQDAFVEHDAMQCGFCTPGFVMSVRALLDTNPTPTLDQVKHACAGNVCRCGTYPKVFDATLDAARRLHPRQG